MEGESARRCAGAHRAQSAETGCGADNEQEVTFKPQGTETNEEADADRKEDDGRDGDVLRQGSSSWNP